MPRLQGKQRREGKKERQGHRHSEGGSEEGLRLGPAHVPRATVSRPFNRQGQVIRWNDGDGKDMDVWYFSDAF